jgi:hypothetical protein
MLPKPVSNPEIRDCVRFLRDRGNPGRKKSS